MSLTVYVFQPGEDGKPDVLDPPDDRGSELAGFESYRTVVWGSEAVRALGARFFPLLALKDLWVQPEEVEEFQRECALLRDHLDEIAVPDETGRPRRDTVSDRLANIEATAARARSLGGGVVIW